jgi:gamma-tubulin complex component 3
MLGSWNATSGTAPGAGGRPASRAPLGGLVLVSKDPDNIRKSALREYTELDPVYLYLF